MLLVHGRKSLVLNSRNFKNTEWRNYFLLGRQKFHAKVLLNAVYLQLEVGKCYSHNKCPRSPRKLCSMLLRVRPLSNECSVSDWIRLLLLRILEVHDGNIVMCERTTVRLWNCEFSLAHYCQRNVCGYVCVCECVRATYCIHLCWITVLWSEYSIQYKVNFIV